MNFTDLYKKISSIDSGLTESEMIQECPCEQGPEQPKQQDSVNMNVSINGQGANGIRDLMDILRNIDSTEPSSDPSSDHDAILVGEPEDDVEFELEPEQEPENDEEENEPLMTDDYENSAMGGSDAAVYGISAVTAMGNDMFSKGKEAPKQAGGGNPWNVKESLVNDLHKLYQEIKQR